MNALALGVALCGLMAGAALAAPGEKIYGAGVEAGVTEFEVRYGHLDGGPDDGEWATTLEIAHHFNDRFYAAALLEIEHEPGGGTKAEAAAIEAKYYLGRIPGIGVDVAAYGEYELGLNGNDDAFEAKAIFQKTVGRFDGRLNLIAEKPLGSGAETEWGYAASADWEAFHDVRLGVAAVGELGEGDSFGGRRGHYVGPNAKWELDEMPGGGEFEIEAGYLFAAGAARDDANGQFRVILEWEKRF